jgi:hypothetical protein
MVGELARHASEGEAFQAGATARADDDEVGALLGRHVDDGVGGIALPGVLLDREPRLHEPALAAGEHVRRNAAQVDRLLPGGHAEPLQCRPAGVGAHEMDGDTGWPDQLDDLEHGRLGAPRPVGPDDDRVHRRGAY